MPQCTGHARARRKKLFARISSSTFIKNKSDSNSSILEPGKILHSKSTYFYRCGSRKCDSGDASDSSLASFQRHPVGLCLLRANCKPQDAYSRNAHPAQPEDDVLWKDCRRKNLGKASRLTYLVPSMCALALLVGGVVAINPQPNRAYAEEGDGSNGVSSVNSDGNADAGIMPLAADSTISLRFNDDASFTAPATANEVAYITNTFTVNVNKYANYTVKLNAMNGSGTELRGKDNAFATIKGVGTNKTVTEFADDTWGYSYKENPSGDLQTIAAGLRYNSMPAYGSEEAMVTKNLTGTEENLVDNYLLAFAAKISSNSPADHYIGNFLLSVVGQAFIPETYYLTYNANSGTGGPNQQSCTQTSYQSPCNIVITNEVPTRAGYTFLGWADSASAGSAQYSAGSTITLSKSQTLYAVWSKDTVYTLSYNANNGSGAPAAQTYTEPGNSSATSHTFTISATKPTRNGYTFLGWSESSGATSASYQPNASITVSKTAPTKTLYAVWKVNGPFNGITRMDQMTNGICGAAKVGDTAQLIDDRDGISKKYWVTKLADQNCWMTQNLAYGTTSTTSIGTPCTIRGTSCSGWSNSTTAKYFAIGSHSDGNHSSQGNFYNWPAAVAGDTSTTEPKQGICPDKWQLPTSNNTNSKSFGGLVNAYSISAGSKLTETPLFFQYGGYVANAALYNAGSRGYYWSSAPYTSSSIDAYNLSFGSSSVNPSYSLDRSNGFSVRCVAK